MSPSRESSTRDDATAAAISTFIATTKLIVVEGITIIPIPDEANIWQQEVLSIKYVDDVAGEGMTMDTTVSEMQYLVHTTIVTKVNKRHWLEKQEEHIIHVYIYNIYMIITYIARVRINRVTLPILLVVSWSGKINYSLSPFASENLVSRDGFGSPVPRQPALSPYSG